jgi:PAS domain S-box-containing protein
MDDHAFRELVDHSMEGLLFGDPEGRIIYANPAACEMFAATLDEVRSAGRTGVVPAENPAFQALLEERRRSGRARGTVPLSRLDGRPFLAEVSSVDFALADGDERTCVVVRDVTERVRRERRLQAFDEITAALLAGSPTTEVLGLVTRHACAVFDATFASIVTPSVGGNEVVVTAAHGPGASAVEGRSFPSRGVPCQVIDTGRALLVEDVSASGPTLEASLTDLGPGMIVPMASEDIALGALFVGARIGRQPYGVDDLAAASQYAARSAFAVAMGATRTETEGQLRVTAESLQNALETRVVIEQAKGYVSCLHQLSPEAAFERIRRYARNHGVKIHSAAQMVVERKLIL